MNEDGRVITTRRRAVKAHLCDVHGGWIKSGSLYLRHSGPPEDGQSGWEVTKECGGCATMFGRAGLLEDKEK